MTACIEHKQASEYGHSTYQGKPTTMHRIALLSHTGMSHEDAKGLVARHKCDNPRCINPEHLEWGTQKDNIGDRIKRGRAHGRAKLDVNRVRAIRSALAAGQTHRALSKQYGISTATISEIRNLLIWVDSAGNPL